MTWFNTKDYREYAGSQDPILEEPGFFEGSLSAIPRGITQGGAATIEFVDLASAGLAGIFGDYKSQDELFKQYEEKRDFRKSLGENDKGAVAAVLQGAADVIPSAIVNLPLTTARVFGVESGQEISQGRTLAQAEGLGALRAGTVAIGAKIPAALAPKYGLAATLGYGALSNVGLGVVERTGENLIVEDGQAIFDPVAMTADAIFGLTFGSLEYRANKSALDAALRYRETAKAEDSAPGATINGEQMNAHMKAVADTIKGVEDGLQPDLSGVDIGPLDPRMASRISETHAAIDEIAKTDVMDFRPEKTQVIGEQKPIEFIETPELKRAIEASKEPVYKDIKAADLQPEAFKIMADGITKDEVVELMRSQIDMLKTREGMPEVKTMERESYERGKLLESAREALEAGKKLDAKHIEAVRQAVVAKALMDGKAVPKDAMGGNKPLEPVARNNAKKLASEKPKAPESIASHDGVRPDVIVTDDVTIKADEAEVQFNKEQSQLDDIITKISETLSCLVGNNHV